ncbi:MAG: HlyD family efflux transporter periplasmic adaptor subunit [Propionicimonas sp.]|nr:HlyD family efflux transporter periplasmic adaptor subunit [Propionicimonas sp.]
MIRRAALVIALITAFALLAGCSTPSSGVTVTGEVVDSTEVVTAPLLAVAVVNPNVGFGDSTESAPTSDVASVLGLGSTVRIASVAVAEGDTVSAGQVVATVDPGTLPAQLAVAKADQAAAKAQIGVLAAAIDDTYDKAQTVAENKQKVDDAIKKLTAMQGKVAKALKQLKKTRSQLTAKLNQAEQLLANYPPVAPPGMPTQEELKAAIAQLKAGLTKVNAGIKQATAAQPKLKKGLKQARQGRRKLNDAAATIVDVRAQLQDAKELATIAAAAAQIPVDLADAQLALTELTAPVAGVVIDVAQVGDQLGIGAPVVTIRPDVPSRITAWLSPAQAAQVCTDDTVAIVGDWMPEASSVSGTLTRLGDASVYPPSDAATDEIHLTRALEAEFTSSEQLPAGVPVDVTIDGCREATATNETNG